MSRFVVYGLDGDPGVVVYGNCQNTVDMGPYLVTLVGEGNPCYVTTSLPSVIATADEIGANFNDAPLVSADYQTNRLMAAAQIADPVAMGATDDGTNKVWKVA